MEVYHRSTGTPAQHFGGGYKVFANTNGGVDRAVCEFLGRWWDATDGTREAYIDFQIYNASAGSTQMRLFRNGSLSIGGVPPKPTNSGVCNVLTGFAIGNAATLGNVLMGNGNEFTDTDVGAWSNLEYVTSSDATNATSGLVDITGLVTPTLALGATYEFEAVLFASTSADTNGNKYAVHCSVAPSSLVAMFYGPTTTSINSQAGLLAGTSATNIAQGAYLTTASSSGVIIIKGYLVTSGFSSPVFSIRHLHQISGTSTVKRGSTLKIRKVSV